MTSSSEEDSLSGAEGRGARSESVTYPRFFLVGMTSSSDLSSSLTGAGAGAGNASGTRSRSAAASSFDHLVSKAPTVRPVPSRSAIAGQLSPSSATRLRNLASSSGVQRGGRVAGAAGAGDAVGAGAGWGGAGACGAASGAFRPFVRGGGGLSRAGGRAAASGTCGAGAAADRLGRRLPCTASVNKGKAQDSFVRRRPSLVAGVCRSAHRAPERCDVEGKQKKSRRGARGPARGKKKLAHY